MPDGLDAMKSARAAASSGRKQFVPPPPYKRQGTSESAPPPPGPPSLAVVAPSADRQERNAQAIKSTVAAPAAAVKIAGPTPEYQALKAVSDAALGWAAQTRKLAVKQEAVARAVVAARQGGVGADELIAAIAAAEEKAAARFDREALSKLLD